ncbi:MAG: outer membrane protein transport protein [Myxococcales bacterium]|nr:outer membrane protein transport protein [Myxococcales bacterium]
MIGLWCAATALASGFEVAQQGAVAGGTGHASVARVTRADDPGAAEAAQAWANPAALADDKGLRLAIGGALAAATIQARSTDADQSWFTETEPTLATPPHLYASYARGRWLAGISTNTAFAGGVRWPADGPLRFTSIQSAPRFVRIAPFAGVRAGTLQLSVGAHVDVGGLRLQRATDHVVEEGLIDLDLRGGVEGVALGLSYKGRTQLALRGWADFDVPAAFAAQLPDQGVATTWMLPDRLTAGASVQTERLLLLADVGLTLWSVNQRLRLVFDDPATATVTQQNAWRSTLAVRLGGEVLLGPVALRAGAYADGLPEAPPPARWLSPTSPDGTRLAATLGAGVGVGERVRVDAFAEHLRIGVRIASGAEVPAAAYAGFATIAGLTASVALR